MKTAFEPIADAGSRILILGTMPGERSLQLQQYYGHPGNHFWKIMFSILERPFSTDYLERIKLLADHKIALWDVLQNCEGEGSSDNAIKNEIPNDFKKFYKQHENIKVVFFASKRAEDFYNRYVIKNPDRNYHVLPSPSRANTWKTYDEKKNEWRIVIEHIKQGVN